MTTVRLDAELEAMLDEYAALESRSKSDVIKQALHCFLEKRLPRESPAELGADLFGRYASGHADASVSYKERLKAKLHEKYAH